MSFVGTRPEVVKYVKKYKPEYFATLLLPAGITSEASIKYKDEAELLDAAEDVDEVYITKVLPEKMKYNLSKDIAKAIERVANENDKCRVEFGMKAREFIVEKKNNISQAEKIYQFIK